MKTTFKKLSLFLAALISINTCVSATGNPLIFKPAGSKSIVLNQQSLFETFLREKGCRLLATCAHPSNTFKTANFRVSDNSVWVDIYYENGYETTLEMYANDDFFTGINVTYNNDFPAFLAIKLIKDLIMSRSNQNDEKSRNFVERYLHKQLEDMDGKDLTCIAFSASWLNYKGANSGSPSHDNSQATWQPAPATVPGLYPQASERLLNDNDLSGKSAYELKIMRNEIYARRGFIFKTSQMKSYFNQQSWYRGIYDNVDDQLSYIEKSNVALIQGYENR